MAVKKSPKLYFISSAEKDAVLWFKANNRGKWLNRALQEVAYDQYHAKTNWGKSSTNPPRSRWIYWSLAPFGNADFNKKQIRAIQCIRRNVYFPDIAHSIGVTK